MTPAPRDEMPLGDALSRYLAYFGPICNHHRDECPDDCEGQLAWQASAELTALLSEADAARAKAIEDQRRGPELRAFCKAFDVWLRCCAEGWGHNSHQVDALRTARLLIVKSSLLARLVYDGEPLRTEKCPKHNGKWSGIPTPTNDCPCGMTGWLPVAPTDSALAAQDRAKEGNGAACLSSDPLDEQRQSGAGSSSVAVADITDGSETPR